MPRKHAVSQLAEEEVTFIIEMIIDGNTDRQISVGFEQQFKKPLAKSSLSRWRKAAGDELADQYKLVRYQSHQLLEDLKQEDGADKLQVVLGNIEDRLLTAMHKVISADPIKLLRIRLDEEKRRQKDRQIELERERLDLEREKLRGVALDRVRLAEDFLADVLEYVGNDPSGLKWFKKNAAGIVEFIKSKDAEAKA